jgi:CHAT domain-containing protein/tetratricopeptide (TPR) repeat protein
MAVTDLYNIAYYYDKLSLLKKSLDYYDSAMLYARRGPDIDNVIVDSRLDKAYLYFRMGDYEKAAEESDWVKTYAVEQRDTIRYMNSLIQRAQALCFQGRLADAQQDAHSAVLLARTLRMDFQLASALNVQAIILSSRQEFSLAEASYIDCIAARMKSKQFQQVSADYNDLGVFYTDSVKDFKKAAACYALAIQFARKEGDSIKMAAESINQGRNYFFQWDIDKAISCFVQAIDFLKLGKGGDLTLNPTAGELSANGNKEVIQILFNSKTELLLGIYRQTHDPKWLTACLQTALLNDSLIREMRHEQVGEQSKLYWRRQTRGFFIHALEACYLAHDDRLAFFFMEESRSVLLQDKLNELGASALLPKEEAAREERLQISIVELQQKLSAVGDISRQGRAVLQELLVAKESLEQFIQTLEKSYPAYYQYKYADQVRSLSSLQELLTKNKQVFVDYFIEDTVCYALCIQPGQTSFVKSVNTKSSVEEQLVRFLRFCSDENALNRDFGGFLTCSNGLYNLLLKPFQLTGGRVIICQDNNLIPFEALSTDPMKANFLIKDYSFSYVYSARYLMNSFREVPGKGDFLGIAPVSFTAYSGLPDLKLSEDALRNCSAPYNRSKLLTRGDANRQNFIRQVVDYNTTTILTHARADSSDEEPLLFMSDSVIRLSELQLLENPAAKLIVLSACQTNVGKRRNGEGIFSMARGFSAAGIPAVAATQWMADEAAIYSISQKFNEYLSLGMNKDEALQKAKLFYIYQDKRSNILPCYWADMILIGNTDPVRFSAGWGMGWYVLAFLLVAGCGIVGIYWFRRRTRYPDY